MYPGYGPRPSPSSTSNQNQTRPHYHQYQQPQNFIPLQVQRNPPRLPIQQPPLHHHTYQHNPNPCPINRTKISKKAQTQSAQAASHPFNQKDSEVIKLYEEKTWDYSIGGNIKKSEIIDLEFLGKLSEIQITPDKCDEHQFKMKKCPVTLNSCYICHHCNFMRCVNPNCQSCLSAIAGKTNNQQQQQQQQQKPRPSPNPCVIIRPNNINNNNTTTIPQAQAPHISLQFQGPQTNHISIQQNFNRIQQNIQRPQQQMFPLDNPFLYLPQPSLNNSKYNAKSPTKTKANYQSQSQQNNSVPSPSLFQNTNYGSPRQIFKESSTESSTSSTEPPSSASSTDSDATIVLSNTATTPESPDDPPFPNLKEISQEIEKKDEEIDLDSSDEEIDLDSSDEEYSSSSSSDEETRQRNSKLMKKHYLMMKDQLNRKGNSNASQVNDC